MKRRPVLLVASSGGHLLQLLTLRAAWDGLPTVWVSNDKEDARSLLAAESAHFLPGPYSRNVRSLLANLRLAQIRSPLADFLEIRAPNRSVVS